MVNSSIVSEKNEADWMSQHVDWHRLNVSLSETTLPWGLGRPRGLGGAARDAMGHRCRLGAWGRPRGLGKGARAAIGYRSCGAPGRINWGSDA